MFDTVFKICRDYNEVDNTLLYAPLMAVADKEDRKSKSNDFADKLATACARGGWEGKGTTTMSPSDYCKEQYKKAAKRADAEESHEICKACGTTQDATAIILMK